MDVSAFQSALAATPLWLIALGLFIAMTATMFAASAARLKQVRDHPPAEGDDSLEGYLVSAVLGLLALLMGFTFSLAVERFEGRRLLVIDEANAIGAAYLRAQMLPEPHRARMSDLLVRYTDNRIVLAQAKPAQARPLLVRNEALLTDIWTAATASFPAIKGMDFSSTYVEAVNNVVDLGVSRKAARLAHVPPEVFLVLFVYMIVSAGVLGHVLCGRRRFASTCLLLLLTASIAMILDIDRPSMGAMSEDQGSMKDLRSFMAARPPQVFDRWTVAPASEGTAKP